MSLPKPLKYDYQLTTQIARPIARIRVKARHVNGSMTATEPIDVLVDTGAGRTALPKQLLVKAFGNFSTQTVDGWAAGNYEPIKLALLNDGSIEFLDDRNNPIHEEQAGQPDKILKIALRETKLLGRDVINRQVYEFDGNQAVLTIR